MAASGAISGIVRRFESILAWFRLSFGEFGRCCRDFDPSPANLADSSPIWANVRQRRPILARLRSICQGRTCGLFSVLREVGRCSAQHVCRCRGGGLGALCLATLANSGRSSAPSSGADSADAMPKRSLCRCTRLNSDPPPSSCGRLWGTVLVRVDQGGRKGGPEARRGGRGRHSVPQAPCAAQIRLRGLRSCRLHRCVAPLGSAAPAAPNPASEGAGGTDARPNTSFLRPVPAEIRATPLRTSGPFF